MPMILRMRDTTCAPASSARLARFRQLNTSISVIRHEAQDLSAQTK